MPCCSAIKLFQNPIVAIHCGVAFASDRKTHFMKAIFVTLLISLGLLCSQPIIAQDSSKLNSMQSKVSRSERKEARLRKKADRKQRKASHKEKKLARQEKKSARHQRKLDREQRKLQRQQKKNGTPPQSAVIFYWPGEDKTRAV